MMMTECLQWRQRGNGLWLTVPGRVATRSQSWTTATRKARLPRVDSLTGGTTKRLVLADHRGRQWWQEVPNNVVRCREELWMLPLPPWLFFDCVLIVLVRPRCRYSVSGQSQDAVGLIWLCRVWCNGYHVGLWLDRSQIRLLAVTRLGSDFVQVDCTHMHASVTKQYNLVPFTGRRCPAAGKVTAGGSGVTLAMCHRLQWFINLWAQGLSMVSMALFVCMLRHNMFYG